MAGFQGKSVLVLGGSRGIGAAIVRRFAGDGAAVTFTYAGSKGAAERLAAETGATAVVTDSADREAVIARVRDSGPLDVLVVNAGVGSFGDPLELDPDAVDRLIRVNVNAPYHAAVEAARRTTASTARDRFGPGGVFEEAEAPEARIIEWGGRSARRGGRALHGFTRPATARSPPARRSTTPSPEHGTTPASALTFTWWMTTTSAPGPAQPSRMRLADARRLRAAGSVEVALGGAVAKPHARGVAGSRRGGVAEQRDGTAAPQRFPGRGVFSRHR